MNVTGTVEVSARVEGVWPVSTLTEGWEAEEVDKLAQGDEEALNALKDEALSRTLDKPDECDMDECQIHITGKEADAN